MPPVTPAAATEHKAIVDTLFDYWSLLVTVVLGGTIHGGRTFGDRGDREDQHPPERLLTMLSTNLPRNIPGRTHRMFMATLVLMAATAACSDTDRSASRFCGSLKDALPDLTATLTSSDDISSLVNRFEGLNSMTPVAIEEEWQALTELVQLAASTDPLDPQGRQTLADAAYQTERPARDIERWVEATCGFQMPDVIGLEGPYVP